MLRSRWMKPAMVMPGCSSTDGFSRRLIPAPPAPSARRWVTACAVSRAPTSVSSTKPQIGSRMIFVGRLLVARTAAVTSFVRSALRMLLADLAVAFLAVAFFAVAFFAVAFFAVAFLGLAAMGCALLSKRKTVIEPRQDTPEREIVS